MSGLFAPIVEKEAVVLGLTSSAKEPTKIDSMEIAVPEERTTNAVTVSSSLEESESVASLLPASTTALAFHDQLPPDQIVFQDFLQSSNKLTALAAQLLGARQKAEKLSIQLAQRQATINDLQKRRAEDEDALWRVEAHNSDLELYLQIKETDLAELRSQLEEEKQLREKCQVSREQLAQMVESAKTSKAEAQNLFEAKATEHEEAMRKAKMDVDVAQIAMEKARDGEMKMREVVSQEQKLNQQLMAEKIKLEGEVKTLEMQGVFTQTLLDEKNRQLQATEDALQKTREYQIIREMEVKKMFCALARECALRSIRRFEECQMEDIVVPPTSYDGANEPSVLLVTKVETTETEDGNLMEGV